MSGALVVARATRMLGLHVLLKARGLLLVPVLARLLGPEGLAVITLAGTTAGMLNPLLSLGLANGLAVYIVRLDDALTIRRTYSSVVWFCLGLAGAGSLAAAALISSGTVVSLRLLSPHAAAFGVLVAGTALRDLGLVVPQLRQDASFVARWSLAVDYGGAVFAIWAVSSGGGPGAVLWSLGLSLAGGVVWALTASTLTVGGITGFDAAPLRATLAIGLPVIPIGLAQWALQSLDNLFLAAWHGDAIVGTYGVAYTLASVVLLVLAALNFVYLPTAAAVWRSGTAALAAFVDDAARWVTLILGAFVVVAVLLSPWGVALIVGPRFARAAAVLPLVVASYSVFTLTQVLQIVPVVIQGRTGGVARCYLGAALANLLLNFALIPTWSMRGAAWATLLSYLVAFGSVFHLGRRLLPEQHWLRTCARATVPGVLCTLAAGLAQPKPGEPWPKAAAITLLLLAAYAALAWLVRVLRADDIGRLKRGFRLAATTANAPE